MEKKKDRFLEYIGNNFDKVKNKFEEYITNMGHTFDEDVFSETLLKCDTKMKDKEITGSEMQSYFFMAFKNNTLREKKYARNNTTDKIPENLLEEEPYDEEVINDITRLIIENFGTELYGLFLLHANGKKYKELEEMTTLKNLKYKFRKIREFVRKNYKLERL